MTGFFKKIQKKNILDPFLALFAQIWAKMNFLGKKKPLPVFRYSKYLPSCKKSEETNDIFLRKIPPN